MDTPPAAPPASVSGTANGSRAAVASHVGAPPSLPALALAALGIVFGDLGTSPLYALQEAFHGSRGVTAMHENVLGIVSLFLWSLLLMVSVKYVALLMRAGNRGEGGILALLALLLGDRGSRTRRAGFFVALALLGAAMLYGDGVITPAISVLSAVEGLEVATPALRSFVVPVTIGILIVLFVLQPIGSGRVGRVFGPILATWFVVIAILGAVSLAAAPEILAAIDPRHAVGFFLRNGGHGFLALGAVVLCLTGGEALYADMGHFGPRPIRVAWYTLALPALVLSYLGQGAQLLQQPEAADRPFYSMVPSWALYPVVALATAATVVASQALISAVFSLTRQAAQLGYAPRVLVRHTSGSTIGQIYLPGLNWILMAATIGLVLGFRSSAALAAAFGLAVSATMAVTTLLFAGVARVRWGWSRVVVVAVAGSFLAADLAFFVANLFKFRDGGWLPLVLGGVVFLIMSTWRYGRTRLSQASRERSLSVPVFLASLSESLPRVRGTAVFLTEDAEGAPLVLLHHLKHNQVLHESVVLLTLVTEERPYVPDAERVQVQQLSAGFWRVIGRSGFMEEPDAPRVLLQAAAQVEGLEVAPLRTTYYLGRQTVVPRESSDPNHVARVRIALFRFLRRNERSASMYFEIPPNRVVELGARVEI